MSHNSMEVRKAISIIAIAICLSCTNAVAADLSAVMSIDKTAQLASDRLYVLITGTYTCGPLEQPQPTVGSTYSEMSGSLRQASGREIAESQFYYQPLCDGQTHSFEVGVQPENIPWHGGNARVQGSIYVQQCDEFYECDTAQGETNVQIKIQGGGSK
jgi:hypothetical protein